MALVVCCGGWGNGGVVDGAVGGVLFGVVGAVGEAHGLVGVGG
jgi:hypothetical protein